MVNDIEEEGGTIDVSVRNSNINVPECVVANRKERRKMAKKEKRKKMRKELAELARMEEEARINDPEEQLRLKAEEEIEKARIEKERIEFEERERKILEDWEIRKALEEDEEKMRIAQQEEDQYKDLDGDVNGIDEDGWEYVEEGPPEIIWQGNEIIVKKKIVRVKKNDVSQQIMTEEPNRPTSNPPPPQSEAFADYKSGSTPSAQQLLNNVAQQTPNFGTEQDKSHCPFHLKTGACRFGSRCSRIHFYPDKSCTLLMKNMYNGPGLAWEQDEGLEHTDEEIEHAYEEFYEDVHTEFLKFGEIVNFKVCRNGSPHLRGNVYVHYTSLDSALSAYQSLNGRYFAGKQIQCEYVGVIKWRVAICGEFMKSKLKTCSRGMTCNFIHCFRNPSGDYEWADWDKPPPRYWLQKMVALFGYFDGPSNCRQIERESPRFCRDSSRTPRNHTDRYHIERSQSREDHSRDSVHYSKENTQTRKHGYHHRSSNRKQEGIDRYDRNEESSSSTKRRKRRKTSSDSDSDKSCSDRNRDRGCNNGKSECRERERHGRRIRDENDRDSVKSIKDRSKYYHREHSQEPSYSGRSYRSYSSRRDSCEPENESPYRKKISKRNRETETVFDSETRVNFIEEKEYCSDDESGRWEPETGVSLSTDISVYSKCNMNST